MAETLRDVIKELKIGRQQDQFLAENRQNQDEAIQKELAVLNKMFGAFFAQQKPDGDDLEEKREEKRKKREDAANTQKSKNGPSNFKDGFFQGTGLSGIFGKVKDLAGAALAPFTGALAGVSLGGLMGAALGRVFMGVTGVVLGAAFLDKWVDPIVDKITGDDTSADTMFGEIDISKIVSGIGGALGLLFGPKLLGAMVGSYFTDIGGKEGGAKYRLMFLRRLGLAGLILAAASFSGDYLQGLGAGEGLSGAVSMALTAAGIGFMLLGGKGLIIGAIAGFAIGAVKGIYNYLNEKGKEAEEIVLKRTKENVDKIADALKEGDTELANKQAKEITSDLQRLNDNMIGGTTYMDFMSEEGHKFRNDATAAALAAGQASADPALINAANRMRADMIGDNAANITNDDLMAELRMGTQGMSEREVNDYLGQFMLEAMSGSVANEDQQRLITFVSDNLAHLSKTLGDQAFRRSEEDLMAQKNASADAHALAMMEVIDNNTGVIDFFNRIATRMSDMHSFSDKSLIGRLMNKPANDIPLEAQGMGATPAMNAVDARNQSSNNTSNITNMHTGLVSQDRGLSDGP